MWMPPFHPTWTAPPYSDGVNTPMTAPQQPFVSAISSDDIDMWFKQLEQPYFPTSFSSANLTKPITPFPQPYPSFSSQPYAQCVCSESAKEIEELKRQNAFLKTRCEFLERTLQSRKRAAEDVPELVEHSQEHATREILTNKKLPADFNDDTIVAEVHLKELEIERIPGSVTDSPKVYAGDMKRFRKGQWANDNIIDYSLFQLMYQHWHPTQFETTHVFNSLFIASLRRNFTEKDFACTRFTEDMPVTEALHENVGNVLNYQVDVFKKDILVIPACLSSHWVLAVALNPRNALLPGKVCTLVIFNSLEKDKKNNRHLTALIREYLCAMFEKTKRVGGKYFESETQKFTAGQVIPLFVKGQPIQTNLNDCGFYLLQNFTDFFTKNGFKVILEELEKADWSKVAPQASIEAQQMREYILKCILNNYDQDDRARLGFA